MHKITESVIEEFAINLLKKQGYQYIYGPDIAPDADQVSLTLGETEERGFSRKSFEDVLLPERLQTAVGRINPGITADAREDAIRQIQRLNSPELIVNNEAFHRMLTEGIKITYPKGGEERGDLVWLIDFKEPENNDFLVINQFTVVENDVNKRPDIILFVNGLPLVVIELKNPADENATVKSAYKQLQTTFLFIMVSWLFPMVWKQKQVHFRPVTTALWHGKQRTAREHTHVSVLILMNEKR